MPYYPSDVTLSDDVAAILNTIRANSSLDYQNRVPVATQLNLQAVGNPITNMTALGNEFLTNLVNRIARVEITSKSYQNPWRRFKGGVLEYGESVEEVFVNAARAQTYDPIKSESTLYKREIPDVMAAFHRLNTQDFYKVTVSNEQLRQAFLSQRGILDLINYIVDSLYTGAEWDEYTIMTNLINDAISDGAMYPVNVSALTTATASDFVTTLKGYSGKLEFMNTKYNPSGATTHTRKNKQILIMTPETEATIDVNVLASAFNMNKAEFMGQRVLIDSFADSSIVGVLVDENFFKVYDSFIGFTENYNGEGLYWNYFYHVWKIYSRSPFANGIVFTTGTNTITSVTITGAPTSVTANGNYNLSATVNGTVGETGIIPQGVTWEITSGGSPYSYITNAGVFHAGGDWTSATTATVTATSTADNTKKATVTIPDEGTEMGG